MSREMGLIFGGTRKKADMPPCRRGNSSGDPLPEWKLPHSTTIYRAPVICEALSGTFYSIGHLFTPEILTATLLIRVWWWSWPRKVGEGTDSQSSYASYSKSKDSEVRMQVFWLQTHVFPVPPRSPLSLDSGALSLSGDGTSAFSPFQLLFLLRLHILDES